MKKTKIIIPALGILLLSTAASVTGTVAWFAANSKVSVTGMQVKTRVSNNLLIDDFDQGNWATNDSSFSGSVTQTITSGNVIVPISTVDGINYYAVDPTNVKGDGDAKAEQYISVTKADDGSDDDDIKKYYPDAEKLYLDYHYVLKAENTSTSAQKIVVKKLDLLYSGANPQTAVKAFRVAFLVKEFTTAAVNGTKTRPGLPDAATKIYTPSGAVNFTAGEAVDSATTTGTVTYAAGATDSEIASVAAATTKYFEVTTRLWLEGEDKSCTVDTFKGLTSGNWAFNMDLYMQTDTVGGVYAINVGNAA